jgi:hypothetical protein
VAFRLALLWTAPILAGKGPSMSNAIIEQHGDSPGEPSSVQQDRVWVMYPIDGSQPFPPHPACPPQRRRRSSRTTTPARTTMTRGDPSTDSRATRLSSPTRVTFGPARSVSFPTPSPNHQPADRDRPRAAVGGRPTAGQGTSRRRQHAADLPMSNLSGWRSTPSTDTQDCGSSVAARSTSPSSVGEALEGVLWFFQDIGSHLRSVAPFDRSVCNA